VRVACFSCALLTRCDDAHRSGSGRDCYVAAALVGERGSVTGVDMTPPLLEVARKHADAWAAHLGYKAPNMRFLEGRIEALGDAGLADGCMDLMISNCVVNLSPDKRAVLREAHRVLRDGGEMFFSDVYADRRLPASVREDPLLVGGCIGVRGQRQCGERLASLRSDAKM
jgi:arsenite methyltransferase